MEIKFDQITKRFGETVAVDRLSMEIRNGELICLLGPSGCGKSTTLAMLSGLEQPTEGSILFDGKDVTHIPPEKRDIGMVFQNYALYPHMTVEQNITFPLKMRGVSKKERLIALEEMLNLLHLDPLRHRKPAQLSGGQQQRVAIARALIKKPSLLLLDEPFSNLDARLRLELREEIRQLQKKLGITTVFVTHDQEEALSISDRILVLHNGRMQQFSPPKEMYDHPANPFVAGFIGNPPMNFFSATHHPQDNSLTMQGQRVIPDLCLGELTEGEKLVGIRPEDIYPATEGISATITSLQPIGKDIYLGLAVKEQSFLAVVNWDHQYQQGQTLTIAFRKARLFPKEEQYVQ